ncbi:hypothetical protein [Lactiplantibacillus plantarum]|uniref:hypothetical protein n=1 Tax=Lactiplantibacillus plantarum TaxID=1590 RepID=UPI0007B5553C|nr:hypothetical protein [Lactiplantibacillus plantarum]KZU58513.1 hypothetical protein Nizo2814_2777 [Lactiplantibacillus plantarum]QBX93240.1 hypothetical protein DVH03_02260 [Lactiplantibacillus plantarum]
MNLPAHVKIGGIEYAVVSKEKINEGAWGYADYCNSVIYIRRGISSQKQRQTLIDVVVQAMMFEAGLDDCCIDNSIAVPLGDMLDNVLADNKLEEMYYR